MPGFEHYDKLHVFITQYEDGSEGIANVQVPDPKDPNKSVAIPLVAKHPGILDSFRRLVEERIQDGAVIHEVIFVRAETVQVFNGEKQGDSWTKP